MQTIKEQELINPNQKVDASKEREKVVIIDDDYLIRNNIRKIISHVLFKYNLNYEILEGEDGANLISLVNADSENLIRVVITDEIMKKVNGSDAILEIREIQKRNSIKVISVTSMEDEITVKKIIKSGADKVLKKPVKKSILEHVLINFLCS
jgi:response regulator RpfG family c-di-GMP phosphodiesterase